MRIWSKLTIIFLLNFVSGIIQAEDEILLIEQKMQSSLFDKAILDIDKIKSSDKKDYLQYLKTLAYYKLNKLDESLKEGKSFISQFPSSDWIHKTQFLMAEIYNKKKNYKLAEEIYLNESQILFSQERKKSNSDIYIKLADHFSYMPKPEEIEATKPDFKKAYTFYKAAVELDLGAELTEKYKFRMALMLFYAQDWSNAIKELQIFASTYSSQEAKLYLGEALLKQKRFAEARVLFQDITDPKFIQRAKQNIPFSYNIPNISSDFDLEAGVKSIVDFLAKYPGDSISPTLMWLKAQSYITRGRTDEAIIALRDLYEQKGFSITKSEIESDKKRREELGILQNPEDQFSQYQKEALFKIGELLFNQKKYEEAIKIFTDYISQFPNGSSWTIAQSKMIDAEYLIGINSITQKNYSKAEKELNQFINNHPLDQRNAKISYTLVYIQYQNGINLKAKDKAQAKTVFLSTINGFLRLVAKYPKIEESSLAKFMIGVIQEEELSDFENALKTYQGVSWGSKVQEAKARVNALTTKELKITTERIFRTNETAQIKVNIRNIEKLKVSMYKINMESYFRKFHSINGIEQLDLALIEPDKTFDYTVKSYIKYMPTEEFISIPNSGPGAFAINIASSELESTTLVIQSDIDAIVKSSKKEGLVFVEDMVKNTSVAGARILLTDGKKVLLESKTGADGVLLTKIQDLQNSSNLEAFIEFNGHIAATGLKIEDLNQSTGLTPKGYIYTDKPAYKPGELVSIKAILRDIVNYSYAIPNKKKFIISISDSNNKLLSKSEELINEFGSFDRKIQLSEKAGIGTYSIQVINPESNKIFTGSFRVENFKLDKIKLSLESKQSNYFRGEKLKLDFKAVYYFGQAYADQGFTYSGPDGVEKNVKTDANGNYSIELETNSYLPGQVLKFNAFIPGENVSITKYITIALQEYTIGISKIRDNVLPNSNNEFVIKTIDNSGNFVSKSVDISFIRILKQEKDLLFDKLPWLNENNNSSQINSELIIEKKSLTTNAQGQGRIQFTPKEGGDYIIRVSSVDRFSNKITNYLNLKVLNESESKLRLFSNSNNYSLGNSDGISIISNLKKDRLSLICIEGDGIISYQIVKLSNKETMFPIKIANEFFPNFSMNITALDENKLYEDRLEFDVTRQLNISLIPRAIIGKPGEKSLVDVLIVDQNNNPVSAEFSLALINNALLNQFSFKNQPIVSYFQDGLRRQNFMRTSSTNSFYYKPNSTEVNQDIVNEDIRIAESKKEKAGGESFLSNAPIATGLVARDLDDFGFSKSEAAKPASVVENRIETEMGSFWLPSIRTDKDGKAVAELVLPNDISSYKLFAKAFSKDSLVGEAQTELLVRKDFFVSIKSPKTLQENDQIRFPIEIHNLTNFAGKTKVSLTISIDGKSQTIKNEELEISPDSTKELILSNFVVPNARNIQLELKTETSSGLKDVLKIEVPVRKFGLPIDVKKAGIANQSIIVYSELPKEFDYDSQEMKIRISPPINNYILNYLDTNSVSNNYYESKNDIGTESKLLSIAQLYKYLLLSPQPDLLLTLRQKILDLTSQIYAEQNSDGSYSRGNKQELILKTVETIWAFSISQKAGFEIDQKSIESAKTFLKNQLSTLTQDANELKSAIQFALSFSNDSDFSILNRIYRERNEASEATLSFASLALVNIEKRDMAVDLIKLLKAKSKTKTLEIQDGLPENQRFWTGMSNLVYFKNETKSTALAILAIETIEGNSLEVKEGIRYLVAKEEAYSSINDATGIIMNALTKYYGDNKLIVSEYKLDIYVNDSLIKTIKVSRGELPNEIIDGLDIPLENLVKGKNKVAFNFSGTGEYRFSVDFSGLTTKIEALKTKTGKTNIPSLSKAFIHENLKYLGKTISKSTMKIQSLEYNQRSEIQLSLTPFYAEDFVLIQDIIPTGSVLIGDSIKGRFSSYKDDNGRLLFYFKPGDYVSDINYQIASYIPGEYMVLPPLLKQMNSIDGITLGEIQKLNILPRGEKSKEVYIMNNEELFALGDAQFNNGNYAEALENLEALFARDPKYNQPILAKNLLWMRSETQYYKADKLVNYFEILKEKYPELSIPFAKITQVGQAYHDIGEFERAYLIYRAVIESNFMKEITIAGNLEKAGETINAFDYTARLWLNYPDSNSVANTYFSLGQALSSIDPQTIKNKLSKNELLDKAYQILWSYNTNYADNVLADDAAFSLVNIQLDKKDFSNAVRLSQNYQKIFDKSEFYSNFQYMEALAQFSLRNYPEAITIAQKVSASENNNRDLSNYILGQIFHAQNKPEKAIEYYKKVESDFSDAAQAIEYFEEKRISMDEINLHTPGDKIVLPIKYRNIKDINLQVYKVDLMKLYLREKNLSKITQINLSGIAPLIDKKFTLGLGNDYADKETNIPLDLKDEGAYLVVCRGEDLFTSGLVLISPLKIEVQEDQTTQRVRVNVYNTVKKMYQDNVHVKVVGSNNEELKSGETDLRGIFIADGINGFATVIARDGQNHYAFYRGAQWLGGTETEEIDYESDQSQDEINYRGNDLKTQVKLQESNLENLRSLYSNKTDGVQVQQAK